MFMFVGIVKRGRAREDELDTFDDDEPIKRLILRMEQGQGDSDMRSRHGN